MAAQIEAVKEAAQASRLASEQLIKTLREENERLRVQLSVPPSGRPQSRRDSAASVLSAEETPQGRNPASFFRSPGCPVSAAVRSVD